MLAAAAPGASAYPPSKLALSWLIESVAAEEQQRIFASTVHPGMLGDKAIFRKAGAKVDQLAARRRAVLARGVPRLDGQP